MDLRKPRRLAAIAALCSSAFLASQANAVTLSFDDLATAGFGLGSVPSSYGGLDFSCLGSTSCSVVNVSTYGGNPSGYQGAVVSGLNVLSTGFGTNSASSLLTLTRTGGGQFSFVSAYFTGAWRDGLEIDVTGLNGAAIVASTSFTLGAAGVKLLETFNWANLTSVRIAPSGGTASSTYRFSDIPVVAIDDLIYTAAIAAVPEPSTIALLGLGSLATLLTAWRREKKSAFRHGHA